MRSGYSDEIDQQDLAMWRGRVASAMRGKRGQQLLRDLLAALDAMPQKRLIRDQLVDGDDVCLLGAGAKVRDVKDIAKIDPEDHAALASRFDVAACLIKEIEDVNDGSGWRNETPEKRYERVREWLIENIKPLEATPCHRSSGSGVGPSGAHRPRAGRTARAAGSGL